MPHLLGLNYEFCASPVSIVRPYIGGGYCYATYKQEVSDGRTIKGHQSGSYAELGLAFNFFKLDPGQKNNPNDTGFFWLLEVERLWLKSKEAGEDIGGLNYSLGLQLRF